MDKINMNYAQLYNTLYDYGYHAKQKNHGLKYVKHIIADYPAIRSILEVGCSNGVAVKAMQNNEIRAFGIDISNIAIRYAQEKYGTINCNEASVLDIPFKDNYFDAVFTCDMLEHLAPEDVNKGIEEIKRVAKYKLFIKVSDSLEGNHEFTDKMHKDGKFKDVKNLHLTVITLDEWKRKIELCGKWKYAENIMDMFVFDAIK